MSLLAVVEKSKALGSKHAVGSIFHNVCNLGVIKHLFNAERSLVDLVYKCKTGKGRALALNLVECIDKSLLLVCGEGVLNDSLVGLEGNAADNCAVISNYRSVGRILIYLNGEGEIYGFACSNFNYPSEIIIAYNSA